MAQHNYRLEARKATEEGALDHFAAICEDCGFIGASTLKTQARSMYGEGHRAFMMKKEAGRK